MPEIERNEILRLNLYEIGNLRKIAAAHWTEVKNSVGSTFNRGDFTALNAFFWASLDLSQYAKRDTGYTPFKIELVDGAGKKAAGYIGAVGAGAGETLDIEINTDVPFNVSGQWTPTGVGFTISGGKAVALNSNILAQVYNHNVTGITPNILCKVVFDVTDYTDGTVAFLLGGDDAVKGTNRNSSGTFTEYITLKASDQYISLRIYAGGSDLSCDNFSVKKVLDPPSTGVHIVSSLNGITRNWASIESGFDPNNIASWKIYHNDLLPV